MRQSAYWQRLDERLIEWIDKALRRRPSAEPRIAACLGAAAPHSPRLRAKLAHALDALIERGAFARPLYAASVRALADAREACLPALLGRALAAEGGGGLATLCAAGLSEAPSLGEPLARAASCRRPEIAFAAELIRRLRGEGKPGALSEAAARLKESARVALSMQVIGPLLACPRLPRRLPEGIARAMAVLQSAERHHGRWLVFAEAGLRAGDRRPLEEAERRARQGSQTARSAWRLLAWALGDRGEVPPVRATSELVTRLSDRPTADRDMSFLFRLACAGAEGARPLLEQLTRPPLRQPLAIRAAAALGRHYREPAVAEVLRVIADGQRVRLRGLAVAALADAGQRAEARQRAAELLEARSLPSSVWGGLVLESREAVIGESSYRRLVRGWIE